MRNRERQMQKERQTDRKDDRKRDKDSGGEYVISLAASFPMFCLIC